MNLDLAATLAPLTGATLTGPSALTWTATVVTAADPVDPGLDDGFDPNDVSPGVLGFLVIFLAALACIPLFRSMTAKLRKVDRAARLEQEAAETDQPDPEDRPGGPSAPGSPGPDQVPGG